MFKNNFWHSCERFKFKRDLWEKMFFEEITQLFEFTNVPFDKAICQNELPDRLKNYQFF